MLRVSLRDTVANMTSETVPPPHCGDPTPHVAHPWRKGVRSYRCPGTVEAVIRHVESVTCPVFGDFSPFIDRSGSFPRDADEPDYAHQHCWSCGAIIQ